MQRDNRPSTISSGQTMSKSQNAAEGDRGRRPANSISSSVANDEMEVVIRRSDSPLAMQAEAHGRLEYVRVRQPDRDPLYSFDTGHRMHTNWKNSETGGRSHNEHFVLEPFEELSPSHDDYNGEVDVYPQMSFKADPDYDQKNKVERLFSSTLQILSLRRTELDRITAQLSQSIFNSLSLSTHQKDDQQNTHISKPSNSRFPDKQTSKLEIQNESERDGPTGDNIQPSEKDRQALEQELSETRVKAMKLQEQNYMLVNRVDVLEGQLSSANGRLDSLQSEFNERSSDRKTLETKYATLKKKVESSSIKRASSSKNFQAQTEEKSSDNLDHTKSIQPSERSSMQGRQREAVENDQLDSDIHGQALIRKSMPSIAVQDNSDRSDEHDAWINVSKSKYLAEEVENSDTKNKKNASKKKKKKKSEVVGEPDLRKMSSHLFQENN